MFRRNFSVSFQRAKGVPTILTSGSVSRLRMFLQRACVFRLSASVVFGICAVTNVLGATLQQPHPLSEKYSNSGAQPSGGRSGLATIQTRALLGNDGTTELQVTTGGIEPATTPIGYVSKVQMKLLAPDSATMQVDNYRRTLNGTGSVFFYYDGLHRGSVIQTQANVAGIDPSRNDVVTVSTAVVRRPDVRVIDIQAPASAVTNTPVMITGTFAETNGDVGAHATCRLSSEGIELARIPGIWIDASSTVACQFSATFTSTGRKILDVRVTDIVPGDDEESNNIAWGAIDVAAPQTSTLEFFLLDRFGRKQYSYNSTFTYVSTQRSAGTANVQYGGTSHYQRRDVQAMFYGSTAAVGTGAVTLTEQTDAGLNISTTVDVSSLPIVSIGTNIGCAYGMYDEGLFTQVCASPGWILVVMNHLSASITYFDRKSATGDIYEWYCSAGCYNNELTVGVEGVPFFPGAIADLIGSTTYTGTVTFVSAAVTRSATQTIGIESFVEGAAPTTECGRHIFTDVIEDWCRTDEPGATTVTRGSGAVSLPN